MAKKNVHIAKDEVEVIAPDVVDNETKSAVAEEQVEVVEETKASKKDKKSKVEKQEKESTKGSKAEKEKNLKNKKDKKAKAKKEKKSLKKKAAEIISELKKVSKPTFGQVVKNTSVVIIVVLICTLLLFGMDKLFSLIYDLLLPNS